jgi:hypothetical protein
MSGIESGIVSAFGLFDPYSTAMLVAVILVFILYLKKMPRHGGY